MKVTVIGLGYIGLPTAAMFAKAGFNVTGYDTNKTIIEALNKGEITIEEPGLGPLVYSMVSQGRLKGDTKVNKSDVFIIAVPTPINENKTANMEHIKTATKSIVNQLEKGNTVILESTCPPGTIDNVVLPILEKSGLNMGEDVYVAYSPERVLPGKIIEELQANDRVIGGINEKSAEKVREIYKSFVKGEIYITNAKTAEMCKLMENTYRDVNIALANELAITCEEMGINAWEVIELSNKHPRVNLHQPGPGVGGHCLAVDPWFIVEKQKNGTLIRQSREINDQMPKHVFNTMRKILEKDKGKVAILGITYKPNIDDTRESPILKLVDIILKDSSYKLALHDPYISNENFKYGAYMVDSVEEAAKDADLLILGVNHKEYANVDFKLIANAMKTKNIYDTRNFLDLDKLKELGFNTILLGRGSYEKATNVS